MRKTQCRMACGGGGAAARLTSGAGNDRPEPSMCTGSRGSEYKSVGMAASTTGTGAASALCWPWRQCSVQRLAAFWSIWSQPGAMSVDFDTAVLSGRAAESMTIADLLSDIEAMPDNCGQAYPATANCANNSTPISRRLMALLSARDMIIKLILGQTAFGGLQTVRERHGGVPRPCEVSWSTGPTIAYGRLLVLEALGLTAGVV